MKYPVKYRLIVGDIFTDGIFGIQLTGIIPSNKYPDIAKDNPSR